MSAQYSLPVFGRWQVHLTVKSRREYFRTAHCEIGRGVVSVDREGDATLVGGVSWSRAPRGGAAGARERAVLRAEQSSVPHVRLPDPQDRSLRPVLLPGGSGGGRDRLAPSRALVRALLAL